VLTALALAVLVGLGTWQVQRLHWKEGLIARIEARANAAPVGIEEALGRWRETGDIEYLRVAIAGRFRHAGELHLYAIGASGEPGWRIVTPFETLAGPIVLVDRGFVPDALKAASTRAAGQIEGQVTVVGLARAPGEQGLFSPDNEVERNIWFWRDLKGMGVTSLDAGEQARVAPFFIEAETGVLPGGWPRGGATRLVLPNRHLEYALTWYGLAAALLAVYTSFLLSRRKRQS
jgi:surfeit locus 1 family protein